MAAEPSRMLDAGQVLTALRRCGAAPPTLRSLGLDRAWPWRGDGVCALFVEHPGAELRGAWAVAGPLGGRLPGRLRRAPGRRRPALLTGLDACAWPLAGDPELIAAPDILAAPRAAERLRAWLPAEGDGGSVGVRALRYKPLRRLTVEYRLERDGSPDWQLYGKALRSRDLGRTERLCQHLARAAGALDLAMPSGVVRPWNLMVFAARSGVELERLIPGPAAARGVELAGEALGALHACGARLPVSHCRRRELETLDRWSDSVGRVFPELAAGLSLARRELAWAAAGLAVGPPCPGHRDFHPGQLLLSGAGATILDLDTVAETEPELDAGNFLAHLDLLELDSAAVPVARLGGVFCAAYERRAGRRLLPQRLLWYRAASLLRLACVYRFRPRGALLAPSLIHRGLELVGSGLAYQEVN